MISLWRSPFKQNNILQVGKLFLLHSLHLHTSNWQLWRWSQWWDAVTSPHLVPISPAMVKLLLDRNIATSLCHPQWQKPCWCLYLEPCTQLMGERIFMQWLTNLLWSAGSRNLLVTGGVPFFFFFTVLGFLMYRILTGMESHLQFIALTSEMISLSHFIVAHCLLFPTITVSQHQMPGSQAQHRRQLLIIAAPPG